MPKQPSCASFSADYVPICDPPTSILKKEADLNSYCVREKNIMKDSDDNVREGRNNSLALFINAVISVAPDSKGGQSFRDMRPPPVDVPFYGQDRDRSFQEPQAPMHANTGKGDFLSSPSSNSTNHASHFDFE
jgi:hypothetical protein